jgi:ABC-type sugar transport system ATPase subunit
MQLGAAFGGNAASGGVALSCRGLRKSFPGVRALSDATLEVAEGEVRALVGSNGAGKSTLVKIITGVNQRDAGELSLWGKAVEEDSIKEARSRGVAAVYQELSLVPSMTVAENIAIGRWAEFERYRGIVDTRRVRAHARAALETLGVDIDVDAEVGELTMAQQQLVEIARALAVNARLLVLDEPTSSLDAHEVPVLFEAIAGLRYQGHTILYISHRMVELRQVADNVTIMRDGFTLGTYPIDAVSGEEVAALMLGHSAQDLVPDRPDASRTWVGSATATGPERADRKVLLEVRALALPPRVIDVSLEVCRGEVVGLAGLMGSGRSELLRCIAGLLPAASGEVLLEGRSVRSMGARARLAAGIAFTSEDRRREGIFSQMSVAENLAMSSWDKVTSHRLVSRLKIDKLTAGMMRRLGIKAGSGQDAGQLSGGNQQKLVLGRVLATEARLLLLDEPTRGVDVQSKEELYNLMREIANEGRGVLFVSSELRELEMCDRTYVVREGKVVGHLDKSEFTTERVTALAMEGGS